MIEPSIRLLIGDVHLCEQALTARHAAILATDPDCERMVCFADETDFESMAIDLRSASLFCLTRHFVIRRSEKCKKPKTLASLFDIAPSEGTFVTMLAGDLKASSPIAKAAKSAKALVTHASPNARNVLPLAREIFQREGVTASPEAVREVVARCGADLSSISQEARKLRSAQPAEAVDRPIDSETIRALTFSQAEETVYPFFDRVGERDLRGALSALAGLRDDPSRILGGIIRHVTRLAMIRLLLDRRTPPPEVAGLVGAQDWLVRRLIGQAKRHTLQQLTAALQQSIDLDTRLKSGGIHPADAVLKATFAATLPLPPSRE